MPKCFGGQSNVANQLSLAKYHVAFLMIDLHCARTFFSYHFCG